MAFILFTPCSLLPEQLPCPNVGDYFSPLPVASEEVTGRNKIPHALTVFIAVAVEGEHLQFVSDIVQTNVVRHTGGNALERQLARPEFIGVVHTGSHYLIVNDLVTSGSSINELLHNIDRKGGYVAGAAVLASAFFRQFGFGANVDIQEETIQKIRCKFNEQNFVKSCKKIELQTTIMNSLTGRLAISPLSVPLMLSELQSLKEETRQSLEEAYQIIKEMLAEEESDDKK